LGQSTYVEDGQSWQIHLDVSTSDPTGAELRLTAFSRLTSRTAFDESLQGRDLGSVAWHSAFLPMSTLPDDTGGGVTVSIPVGESSTGDGLPSFDPDHQSGVFPLQVELFDGRATAVRTLETSLVFVAGTAAQTGFPRLDVSLTLAVRAPTTLPSAKPLAYDATPAMIEATRGTLGRAAVAGVSTEVGELQRHPGVSVDLAVTPDTADSLAAAAGGHPSGTAVASNVLAGDARTTLTTLSQLVASGDELLPSTYVSTSLPSLQAAGLTTAIAAQITAGSTSLSVDLHHAPAITTWVVDGSIDDETLDTLHDLGVSRLILPAADLSALAPDLDVSTFASPTLLSTPAGRFTVQAADAGLTGYFESRTDPVLAANHLLAELAMIQLETPARLRGVAVLPPASWTSNVPFLDTLLGGLRQNPLLLPVTADRLLSSLPVATSGRGPVTRTLVAPRSRAVPLSDGSAISSATNLLTGYRLTVPGAAALSSELSRRLLLAQASDVSAAARASLVSSVVAEVTTVQHRISLPGSTSITLTARKGSLPLSVLSDPSLDAHVQLRLSSDKLIFEPYSSGTTHCTQPTTGTELCQLVLATAVNNIKVPVEARTSGVFTLQITLSSPDGSLALGNNRDTVRSTAVSGVGVVLIILAFLGLAYWWIRNIRHGRRAKQLVEPGEVVVGHPREGPMKPSGGPAGRTVLRLHEPLHARKGGS
jgi:hypothetical protein